MPRLVMYLEGKEVASMKCFIVHMKSEEYIAHLMDGIKLEHKDELNASLFLPVFFIEGVQSKMNGRKGGRKKGSGRLQTDRVLRAKVIYLRSQNIKREDIATQTGLSLRTIDYIIANNRNKNKSA